MSGLRRWADRHVFWVILPIETAVCAISLRLGGDPLLVSVGAFVVGWVAYRAWARPSQAGETWKRERDEEQKR